MDILTENISSVTQHVQNQCIYTQILIFFCNHGKPNLDNDQILLTITNTDGDHSCQVAE